MTLQPPRGEPLRLLFVCVENSNRSQMAEAFARRHAAEMGVAVEAASAGSRPSGVVNPKAIAAMGELGIDLAVQRSKPLSEVETTAWDVVVTMGCGDACPLVRARKRVDWQIPDPKALEPAAFRQVRDLVGAKVRALLEELA
jgi:arsenate reductase